MITRIEVVTLPVDELRRLVREAAEEGARRVLEAVLPPYSQHLPPLGVSRRRFLAACAAGCPHQRDGRTLFVERAAWAAWQDGRRVPIHIDVVKHPPPSNDDLDIDALVDAARRKPRRR